MMSLSALPFVSRGALKTPAEPRFCMSLCALAVNGELKVAALENASTAKNDDPMDVTPEKAGALPF